MISRSLAERMRRLGIRESDLAESFVRASGPGGQHVNKTSTAVQLVHIPTGITVRCSSERSQAFNRAEARRRLLDKIECQREKAAAEERSRREKLRRQKRKRPKAVKERILAEKRRKSEKKALRGRVRE